MWLGIISAGSWRMGRRRPRRAVTRKRRPTMPTDKSKRWVAFSLAAAVAIVGIVAVEAFAKGDKAAVEQKKRQADLRTIDRRLSRIRAAVTADPTIAKARQAAVKAWEAAKKANQDAAKAQQAVAKLVKAREDKNRRSLAADRRAKSLMQKRQRLESAARQVEAEIKQRQEKLESDKDVVEARKAQDAAREKREQARQAYQKTLRDKVSSDAEIKKLRAANRVTWGEYNTLGRELSRIKSLMSRGKASLDAQRAYERAAAAEKKIVQARATADKNTTSAKTVKALGPELRKVDIARRAISTKADADAGVVRAKKDSEAATNALVKAEKAYRKLADAAVAADKEGGKLLAELKKAKDSKARRAIENKLRPIRSKVKKNKNVAGARAARDAARKAERTKRTAYRKARAKVIADNPKSAGLQKQAKDLRAKLDPAYKDIRAARRKAEKDPALVKARKDVIARRTAVNKLRQAYNDGIQAKIARNPEGKKLIAERRRLQGQIKKYYDDQRKKKR